METTYKPLSKNCLVKVCNQINETKSGLIIISDDNVNTEIYEIVSLPVDLPDDYKDLKVGDKFFAWKNWRGFKVGETDTGDDILCIDLLDVAAIVE